MSPRTRSTAKKLTAQPSTKASGSRARKSNKSAKQQESSKVSGGEAPLSAKEQKQLQALLKRQSVQKQDKEEERQAGVRKRAATMTREEVQGSDAEGEEPSRKKARRTTDSDGEGGGDGGDAGSDGEGGGDEGSEPEGGSERDIRMESPSPPARPYGRYKKAEQDSGKGNTSLTEAEQRIAQTLGAKGKAKEKPPSKKSVVVESPRSEDHEEEHASVRSGSEDEDRTRRGETDKQSEKRKDVRGGKKAYVEISVDKTRPQSKKAAKSKVVVSSSDEEQDDDKVDELQSSDNESSLGFRVKGASGDDSSDSNHASDSDDVIEIAQKGVKKKPRGKGSVAARVRVKASNLPINVRPIVGAAQNFLRLRLALKTAWTGYKALASSRLPDNMQLVADALKDARDMRDKDGKRVKSMRIAYDDLQNDQGTEGDTKRSNVHTVVWNVAAQFRNEVKRKGKSVVEHSYGLSNLTVQQRVLLAQWLLKTHPMKVKGGKREIPNFVFGDMKIVWNAKDKLDKEKCSVKSELLFRHPAISEIIVQQWFQGHGANIPVDRFSKVPDNLIALACNSIEAALSEIAFGNPVAFTNKQFAPKWDDLMSILEATKKNAPDYYADMKKQLWIRISSRVEGDDEEDSDKDDGEEFVKWTKLQDMVLDAPAQSTSNPGGVASSTAAKPSSSSKPTTSSSTAPKPSSSGKPSSSKGRKEPTNADAPTLSSSKRAGDAEEEVDADEREGDEPIHNADTVPA
ncbi:uncharacterized protein B0H18DRAFT_1130545 [Fomitopsis serialis]|uniref:uncharacterized protein n=1 Tax=Fomitopsis serialis TaxID=139415 RepID=UPI002007E878|nr:uncharacterized protein B0H18DRAFT_1130545 [Neoantrodia serialis]KAH9910183.1 hypothetical protein B0H18DRAFT_1130545 [Neoantrodia serialis]